MRQIVFKIGFAAAAILLQTSIAAACQCGPRLSVLDEYEGARVVLIARMSAIQSVNQTREAHLDDNALAQMVVEKVYKGDVRVGDTLVFAQGNGLDCGWRFGEALVGQRILMYLQVPKAGSPWKVWSCGRSRCLKDETEDLLYLDKMDQLRGKTRVSGQYEGGLYRGELKVEGRKIRIVGESKTYETTTDKCGIFEIYDLPPGNYRLEPELQSDLIIDSRWLWFSNFGKDQITDTYVAFTLKPQKHVSIQLGFQLKDEKPVPRTAVP